jgi:hypothetical protein
MTNRNNNKSKRKVRQMTNGRSNDRQYDQSILRIPQQKLTLYGTFPFTTTDKASVTNVFNMQSLAGAVKGFNEILTVHNAFKPLGFTISFGPVDVTSKLGGQISQITATRFNSATNTVTQTSTSKLIADNGGRMVYIWSSQNRFWSNDLNKTPGGVVVTVSGFKQNVALFNIVVSLTVVFD